MYEGWAYLIEPTGQPGPDYWTYFAERLASLAAPEPGASVLDIGTDDGNVLFKVLARTGNGTGIGIDIDPRGFQHGIRQASIKGWLNRVAFAQMDGNELGFAEECFDCVLANFVGWDETFDFVSMEFIRPEKITREIWRVLKPGGRVGVGTWIEQSDIDWINKKFREYAPQNRTEGEWATCYARENSGGIHHRHKARVRKAARCKKSPTSLPLRRKIYAPSTRDCGHTTPTSWKTTSAPSPSRYQTRQAG